MRRQLLAAGLAALASVTMLVSPASADHSHVNRDLAKARAATARFHNEAVAIAAGYQRDNVCAESEAGGMGYHYANPALFTSTDVTKPGVLLYAPTQSGKRRLVAIEFIAIDRDQNLATDDDRPSLFGQPYNGPMPGHFEGMPVHYDLHVWLWAHNPKGLFAEWNPRISCTP